MKALLTGDEAIARGAWEAGVAVAAAYPGTPSTEIMENMGKYKEVRAQWSINEKVSLETAAGACLGGARALCAMKHVGLNVAADPLFTMSYIGVQAGLVIVTADDPAMHSSQNEQDNRHYARAAKMPMLEPSDSGETLNFTKLGYDLSEECDAPVLLRITTRIAHSQSIVELGERRDVPVRDFVRDFEKQVMLPSNARKRHVLVEQRIPSFIAFARKHNLNRIEWGDEELGIVTSGVSYNYVKEVFPNATILKYGLSWPVDVDLAREVRAKVKKLWVIEEGDPYLEDTLKAAGVQVDLGKDKIPLLYELNPSILRELLVEGHDIDAIKADIQAPPRPPALCPGCGHRGMFRILKREKAIVFGDIGCYTLAAIPPLSAMDTCICMGASVSASIGMAKAAEAAGRDNKKSCCVIGDSTFMHSGITGLIDAVYNNATFTTIILDNHITAMTGHQVNPVTGETLQGQDTFHVDLVAMSKACGVKEENISTVDTYDLMATREVIRKHWEMEGPSVIVAKSNCVIATRQKDTVYVVETDLCKSCGNCISLGCPAISKNENKQSTIDPTLCTGCSMCAQVCPWQFIHRVDEEYVPVTKPRKVP